MAINGVTNKTSILDTYNSNTDFGSGAGPGATGFTNAKAAGGTTPKTTDFIKGVWPERGIIAAGTNAATGFTANKKSKGLKDTEFAMVDIKNAKTSDTFKPLNTNNDYQYDSKTLVGYNNSKKYKKPANP